MLKKKKGHWSGPPMEVNTILWPPITQVRNDMKTLAYLQPL